MGSVEKETEESQKKIAGINHGGTDTKLLLWLQACDAEHKNCSNIELVYI